jgi:cell division transport system permease protein
VSRLRLVFSESLRSLGANLSTTVAATFTVLIGMFLLGLVIALGTWALSFSDYAKSRLEVRVLFCTDIPTKNCKKPATTDQINAVRVKLESDGRIKPGGVEFVSKAEALDRMKKRSPELVANLVSNPLPPAFEITPRQAEDIKAISASLKSPLPAGVERVRDGEEVSERVLTAAKVISTAAGAATVILLVASLLLIANTIRLSIFSRRREIEVMKLVGATNWFVRGPFMLEGLICGLAGSLAAVFFLLLGKELVLPVVVGRVDTGSGVEAIAFGLNALVIIGVGLVIGVLGSGLTLRRFLQV